MTTNLAGASPVEQPVRAVTDRERFEQWYCSSDARWWNTSDAAFASWCAAHDIERARWMDAIRRALGLWEAGEDLNAQHVLYAMVTPKRA